jgi:hypothetical protein
MGCGYSEVIPMIKKYYADLVNRVFNVLYVYENDIDSFETYVKSLTFELSGNEDFSEIQQIRFKLNALLLNDIVHSDVRHAVLKSISILDKILSNWKE